MADPLLRDPRFRCCCDGMNAPLGAQIFCWIEIAVSILRIGICALIADQGVPTNEYYDIIGGVIAIIVAALVIYAIKKEKRVLIIPHLAWSIIDAVVTIFAIVSTVTYIATTPMEDGEQVQTVPINKYFWRGFIVGLLIRLTFVIWVFVVLLKTYRYYLTKILDKSPTELNGEYTATADQPPGYPLPTAKVTMEQQEKFL